MCEYPVWQYLFHHIIIVYNLIPDAISSWIGDDSSVTHHPPYVCVYDMDYGTVPLSLL